jgi:hypothetical protein
MAFLNGRYLVMFDATTRGLLEIYDYDGTVLYNAERDGECKMTLDFSVRYDLPLLPGMVKMLYEAQKVAASGAPTVAELAADALASDGLRR